MSYQANYDLWKKHYQNLSGELKMMFDKMSKAELEEAFSTDLEFGTAGLRGIIGAGTGRMNIYTIRRATIAFMKFLKTRFTAEELATKGMVIGHDNRKWSALFTMEAAKVFAKHGVKVKLFEHNDVAPTPIVSYAVTHADCIGGIVITASHNPREYNGYKIYDENGCQYLPDATDVIGEFYNQLGEEVFIDNEDYDRTLMVTVPAALRDSYITAMKKMQFYPGVKKDIKIVFSNLHGTAKTWTPVILEELGYEVIIVKEQYEYDENFTSCPKPNPEILENYDLATKYAKEHNADLIILNDPDADRIGIGVKTKAGDYYLLTGNETAPILLEYWLGQHKKFNKLPANGVMYNTFVTGNLSDKVAEKWGLKVVKTLTGFKWIGSRIPLEKAKNLKFMFGFEEAYGYVLNPISRDKDGIQSSIVLAEACDYYHKQGKTLMDVLEDLYHEFGYYYCFTVNEVYEGLAGKETIKRMLSTLRNETVTSLDGIKCVKKEDYLHGLYDMPGQDLLKFYFEDGSWFAVRGSGTEPKIKFYYVCVSKTSLADAKVKMERMHKDLKDHYLNK